jgi:cellobiose phosphorylase
MIVIEDKNPIDMPAALEEMASSNPPLYGAFVAGITRRLEGQSPTLSLPLRVRENGGQYTQAAIWAIIAFAAMGACSKAWELFSMINPISHSSSSSAIETYKVEPYVVASDVYFMPPHAGRGGWTWNTGSAGWMYRR